jgi:hypothetical protein
MRLLDIHSYKLQTFYGDKIPPYAILSHTWLQDHEEVTFAHLHQSLDSWNHLPGARKLKLTCKQAAAHGISWAWIDTCCIDKTNNSELSEAINSMFKWYQRAAICYAFLTDIDLGRQDDMLHSRWWTRAWTLQELLAPKDVLFFDTNWRCIGTKAGEAKKISYATNIDMETLTESAAMYTRSVAQRMSWAACRQATREEDIAYSLLGIFQINMTMQYGEGDEAFVRLQKEIMHTSEDLSLFAWGVVPETLGTVFGATDRDTVTPSATDFESGDHVSRHGLFASHPSSFTNCGEVEFIHRHNGNAYIEEQHGSITLHAPMISSVSQRDYSDVVGFLPAMYWIAILPCRLRSKPRTFLGLLLLLSPAYYRSALHKRDTRQLRSMRSASRLPSLVATFLVNNNALIDAKSMHIKVDSWTRISQRPNADQAPVILRTLTIKTKVRRVPKIEPVISLHDIVQWQVIETVPYSVLTAEQSSTWCNEFLLQYTPKKNSQTLIIGVKLSSRPEDADKVCLGKNEEKVRDFLSGHKTALGLNPSACRIHSGKVELSVKIQTKFIYDQAISTLSIRERKTTDDVDSDVSTGSFNSARATR